MWDYLELGRGIRIGSKEAKITLECKMQYNIIMLSRALWKWFTF